jgi:hypothetical protein
MIVDRKSAHGEPETGVSLKGILVSMAMVHSLTVSRSPRMGHDNGRPPKGGLAAEVPRVTDRCEECWRRDGAQYT